MNKKSNKTQKRTDKERLVDLKLIIDAIRIVMFKIQTTDKDTLEYSKLEQKYFELLIHLKHNVEINTATIDTKKVA